MTIKEIRQQHPFPWTELIVGGTIVVKDANGMQVGLLTIIEFVKQVTAGMAKVAKSDEQSAA
ncbi:hypothetical protein [Castellaniella sp.]|uniref:hypothetical protein n=1 Tax=Castellaniella sp. TaxID=1955812 RepID=UPI002AFEFA56|nr:hypothetical protein [Castellaniella sp.]